jgi:hypothetical protein
MQPVSRLRLTKHFRAVAMTSHSNSTGWELRGLSMCDVPDAIVEQGFLCVVDVCPSAI